jgi:hypothetical protein
MQKSIDDMLSVLAKPIVVFSWSSRVIAQSSKLWAQLAKKLVQSPKLFSHSSYKWAQSTKGVQGKRSGVSTNNVR